MAGILVAGGTGALGSRVVTALAGGPQSTRVLSRKERPSGLAPGVQWAKADIVSGEGLPEALRGIDVVVNCSGNPRDPATTDVEGVEKLAKASAKEGVSHFVHVSIVGIDKIDFDYYKLKLEAESRVAEAGVPYSIQRLTQFHSLMSHLMSLSDFSGNSCAVPVDPAALFQPIDTSDAASHLLSLIDKRPAGLLPDVGGPEIMEFRKIAEAYCQRKGMTDPTIAPSNGRFFTSTAEQALLKGLNTAPHKRTGHVTWNDYLARKA